MGERALLRGVHASLAKDLVHSHREREREREREKFRVELRIGPAAINTTHSVAAARSGSGNRPSRTSPRGLNEVTMVLWCTLTRSLPPWWLEHLVIKQVGSKVLSSVALPWTRW